MVAAGRTLVLFQERCFKSAVSRALFQERLSGGAPFCLGQGAPKLFSRFDHEPSGADTFIKSCGVTRRMKV